MVVDGKSSGTELRECFNPADYTHFPLATPGGQTGVFGPVFDPPPGFPPSDVPEFAKRGLAIPRFGDIRFQHLTFVIDGPSEVVELAVDPDENVIQMPRPVRVVPVLHAALAGFAGKHWPKSLPPKPHCFMRDAAAAQRQ